MLLIYALIINAILGLLTFEWAWSSSKLVRVEDEERDKKFPSRRRLDIGKI
jgi:hypothetical protein